MDETEAYIRAVESFEEKQDPLSEELERFISYIAKTGDILAPWEKVQKVFVNKLHLVLDEFYEATPYKAGKVNANAVNDDFQEMKSRLTQLTEEFDDPPFTIQRLCELLVDPRKNYTKCDKFMRGVEKNLMVVSSWNNLPRRASESTERVNGMVGTSNGYMPGSDRYNPHWANLPPSPIATAPPKIPGAPDFTAVSFPKLDQLVNKEEKKEKSQNEQPMETDEGQSEVKGESSSGAEQKTDDTSASPSKPCVSATIISSSRTTTINIKRKLDGTVVQVNKEDSATEDTELEDASPTKKMKQDGEEDEKDKEADSEKEANSADDASAAKPDIPEQNTESGDSAEIKTAENSEEPEKHDSADTAETSGAENTAESAEIATNNDSTKSDDQAPKDNAADPDSGKPSVQEVD